MDCFSNIPYCRSPPRGRNDKRRDASHSPDEPVSEWKPRRHTKSSNFDVRPPDGITELPGVGTPGAAAAGNVHAAEIMQRYGSSSQPIASVGIC